MFVVDPKLTLSLDDSSKPYAGDCTKLLRMKDATEYIGVSLPTFYKLIRENDVSHVCYYHGHNGLLKMFHQADCDRILSVYDPTGHKTARKAGSRNYRLAMGNIAAQYSGFSLKVKASIAKLPSWDEYCFGDNSDSTEYDEYVALTEIYGISDVERAMTVD